MTIYQKIIAAYGALRSSIDSRMSKYDVASQFSPEKSYSAGDLVIYQDRLYECIYGHSGDWGDGKDFSLSTLSDAIKRSVGKWVDAAELEMTKKLDVADEFNEITDYRAGRMVIYGNEIYRCVSDHAPGPWGDGSDFEASTIDDAIESAMRIVMDEAASLYMKNDGVAAGFDPVKIYKKGSLVSSGGYLYACVEDYDSLKSFDVCFERRDAINVALGEKADKTELESVTSDLEKKADKTDVSALLYGKADRFDLGMEMFSPGQWVFSGDDVPMQILVGLRAKFDEFNTWELYYGTDGDVVAYAAGERTENTLTFENVTIEIPGGPSIKGATIVASRSPSDVIVDRRVNLLNVDWTRINATFYMPPRKIGMSRRFCVSFTTKADPSGQEMSYSFRFGLASRDGESFTFCRKNWDTQFPGDVDFQYGTKYFAEFVEIEQEDGSSVFMVDCSPLKYTHYP